MIEISQWIIAITFCIGVWIGETSLLMKLWHSKGRPKFNWLYMIKTFPALIPIGQVIWKFTLKYPIPPSLPWWDFAAVFALGFVAGVTIMPGFVMFERWFRATWKKRESVQRRLAKGLTTDHDVEAYAIAVVAVLVFIAAAFGYVIPAELQPQLVLLIALILGLALKIS